MSKHRNLTRSFVAILKLASLLLTVALIVNRPVSAQSSMDTIVDLDILRVDTSLVTVNVSVTNGKNRPLPGLTLENFHVMDEGQVVKPEFFDREGPESIVFVIDMTQTGSIFVTNRAT